MEVETINKLTKKANKHSREDFYRLGAALLFMVIVMVYTFIRNGEVPQATFLAIAAMVGGYMAMNIGANDVANNVGPAVGSKALTMMGAIIIAAIFEASGALIAGGDVVSTIKKGIIDPVLLNDTDVFIWAMLAALLGGALWLNIATIVGAPVSTTHSIVGGVMGAGVAAAGWDIVNWSKMSTIAASWVISPVLGGLIAAGFLFAIKRTIMHKPDMRAAAKKVVPILIAIMTLAFVTYLSIKGLKKIVKINIGTALLIGMASSAFIYVVVKPIIARAAEKLHNTRDDINKLFTIPLIFAAALLSFAHGANDVANAIGPLAAINDAIMHGEISHKANIPLWVMLVGAVGIAIGLAMYGPKLIRTVGSEITELDQARAWSIAISSAIVVIIASWLGLPVSSTHIAIGGVFGVGFLRIYIYRKYEYGLSEIKQSHLADTEAEIKELNTQIAATDTPNPELLKELEDCKEHLQDIHDGNVEMTKKERKYLKKIEKEQYIRQDMLVKIIAAWLITVPISALLSAMLYFTIRGIMLH